MSVVNAHKYHFLFLINQFIDDEERSNLSTIVINAHRKYGTLVRPECHHILPIRKDNCKSFTAKHLIELACCSSRPAIEPSFVYRFLVAWNDNLTQRIGPSANKFASVI